MVDIKIQPTKNYYRMVMSQPEVVGTKTLHLTKEELVMLGEKIKEILEEEPSMESEDYSVALTAAMVL